MLYPTLRSEQNGASALDEEHTQIAISALRVGAVNLGDVLQRLSSLETGDRLLALEAC